MCEIIGQDKLLSRIESYTLQSFPKVTLFLGEIGCGKHLMSQYISTKLNMPLIDITKIVDYDYILTTYENIEPQLYLLNIDEMTDKQQNIILKFIEEPPQLVYIILICSNKNIILDTILNRCTLFEFQAYSKEVLESFIDESNLKFKDLLLDVCKTPGQVKSFFSTNIDELKVLCQKIVTSVSKATFQNTLSISSKLNYKDEYNKFDVTLFLKVLLDTITKEIIVSSSEFKLKLYDIVKSTFITLTRYPLLNKQDLIETMLIKIWKISRE